MKTIPIASPWPNGNQNGRLAAAAASPRNPMGGAPRGWLPVIGR